ARFDGRIAVADRLQPWRGRHHGRGRCGTRAGGSRQRSASRRCSASYCAGRHVSPQLAPAAGCARAPGWVRRSAPGHGRSAGARCLGRRPARRTGDRRRLLSATAAVGRRCAPLRFHVRRRSPCALSDQRAQGARPGWRQGRHDAGAAARAVSGRSDRTAAQIRPRRVHPAPGRCGHPVRIGVRDRCRRQGQQLAGRAAAASGLCGRLRL
ncbi:hypothetical protein XPR_3634, partial [Xanthomonas arboricola pv. pruni MAFF 301420]